MNAGTMLRVLLSGEKMAMMSLCLCVRNAHVFLSVACHDCSSCCVQVSEVDAVARCLSWSIKVQGEGEIIGVLT